MGFKKAQLNLGVFDKETKELLGVLQWGVSAQEGIRLDRYVKERITKEEYYELNRFCMKEDQGKNSESQAISLAIKWIRLNQPHIRLLVSYSGRREGKYGYIYQATNWEYLGYFISPGFWSVNGIEKHMITLWKEVDKYGDDDLTMVENLCRRYDDVRQYWTKQFIYIQRLDKSLTPASDILPYPKPATEYPIKTKEKIYKQNDEVFESGEQNLKLEYRKFFYNPDEPLFSRKTLMRNGAPVKHRYFAMYNKYGELEASAQTIKELSNGDRKPAGIGQAIKTGAVYKDMFFREFEKEADVPEEIQVPILCIIDEIPFPRAADAAKYLRVSRQAVSQARLKRKPKIGDKNVEWIDKSL